MEEQQQLTGYEGVLEFNDMGEVLIEDQTQNVIIRAGQIFEGKTVKGGKNLIVAMRVIDGHLFYVHGDRVRKVPAETFLKSVLCGDLEPKNPHSIDVGRLSMAGIALDAIANRRTAEEQIQFMGEHAEERFNSSK